MISTYLEQISDDHHIEDMVSDLLRFYFWDCSLVFNDFEWCLETLNAMLTIANQNFSCIP